jgi:hypothetical protein
MSRRTRALPSSGTTCRRPGRFALRNALAALALGFLVAGCSEDGPLSDVPLPTTSVSDGDSGAAPPEETAPPETAPPETAPPETAPPETAPPQIADVVLVEDARRFRPAAESPDRAAQRDSVGARPGLDGDSAHDRSGPAQSNVAGERPKDRRTRGLGRSIGHGVDRTGNGERAPEPGTGNRRPAFRTRIGRCAPHRSRDGRSRRPRAVLRSDGRATSQRRGRRVGQPGAAGWVNEREGDLDTRRAPNSQHGDADA